MSLYTNLQMNISMATMPNIISRYCIGSSLEQAVLDFAVYVFGLNLDVRIDTEEDLLD